MWSTPLNTKILVTGSIGVDPKLVELKSNYPRYNMLISTSEKEEDILGRIRKKAKRLEKESLNTIKMNMKVILLMAKCTVLESIISMTMVEYMKVNFKKIK